uniref:Kinesin family member C1 n=1 Tax=Taeniopygia guttata TaxID=59729 RepID=A0A674GJ91_TAEGU
MSLCPQMAPGRQHQCQLLKSVRPETPPGVPRTPPQCPQDSPSMSPVPKSISGAPGSPPDVPRLPSDTAKFPSVSPRPPFTCPQCPQDPPNVPKPLLMSPCCPPRVPNPPPCPPGSATSTAGAKGASKRPPWDLRGQVRDLQEALEQGRERLQVLEREKQEQSQRLQQLQRELGERESQESSLCARVSSLEVEVAQVREKLEQSQNKVKALEAEEQRLKAEEQRLKAEEEQRRQERDEAWGRAQALLQQLENAEEQLQELQALRELEASQRSLLAQREEHIHLLEMERRRLHNDIQELRGNIRVFCRVRPLLPEERERQRGMPHLHFPSQDTRSLVLTRPDDSQLGRERRAELRYDFSFDRVFPPAASQEEIFQEIQLLVQSALDGYPVCIFAYGQTGSGKTFTMEGPSPAGAPESRGMIPRAVRHLFRGARDLAAKGWQVAPGPRGRRARAGWEGRAGTATAPSVRLLCQLPGDLQRGPARPAAGPRPARLRAGDPPPGARQRRAARPQPHLGARGERGAGGHVGFRNSGENLGISGGNLGISGVNLGVWEGFAVILCGNLGVSERL